MSGACVAVLSAVLVAAGTAAAVAAPVRHSSGNHFQVEFPDGWVRIADSVARDYATAVGKLTGAKPTYEAFYERHDAAEHFAYPYVMVDYHAGDTRMYREFSTQMEKGFKDAADKLSSRSDGFLDGIDFGKPVLEAPLSRFWVKVKMDVAGTSVTGLSLLKLGDRGIAVVNFYARTEDFESYEAEFKTIAESVRFDAGYRHDPAKGPSFFSSLLGRIVLFGVVGGIVGLVSALARSKRAARDVRIEGMYAPPPPGASLSRSLMDPDSIRRPPVSKPPPPLPRPVAAASTRPPLPPREEAPLIEPGLLRPKTPAPPPLDRWRWPPPG